MANAAFFSGDSLTSSTIFTCVFAAVALTTFVIVMSGSDLELNSGLVV